MHRVTIWDSIRDYWFWISMIVIAIGITTLAYTTDLGTRPCRQKNMICISPDELEQLIYEFTVIHNENNVYKINNPIKENYNMERLSCLFPGVQPVQYVDPDFTEIISEGTVKTIFERYSEGIGPNPETGAMDTEIPVFIRKITTTIDGNVTTIKKEKTFAKWSERTTATYVGVNAKLNEFSVR